jgi:hypothetical protein
MKDISCPRLSNLQGYLKGQQAAITEDGSITEAAFLTSSNDTATSCCASKNSWHELQENVRKNSETMTFYLTCLCGEAQMGGHHTSELLTLLGVRA